MFLRLLWESFARQRRRKTLAGLAILLGATAVTAMLGLATTIGDRIHRELAVYGANIVVYPKADTLEVKIGDQSLKPATGNAYLHESDLAKLRGIFWANNITGISPELDYPAKVDRPNAFPGLGHDVAIRGLWFDQNFSASGSAPRITGAKALHPLWRVEGSYPHEEREALVGSRLASELKLHIGEELDVYAHTVSDEEAKVAKGFAFRIVGILAGGDATENAVLIPLKAAQELAETPDAISRVEISARTRPEDAFARRDPDTLSPKQHDLWYCRPYANSIAYQIREAIPGAAAEQVRQVEQSEGTILERISGLMWLISAAALLAAAVAVSAAMATAVLERRAEIGLMRSLGASKGRIASLFYAEAGLLALMAGLGGYLLGSLLAAVLTAKIFGDPAGTTLQSTLTHAFNPVLFPVVLGLALLVAIAGSTASIRGALRMDPSTVLRSDA